ncbi:MAG: S-layer homology domain-containing protein [Eubacteriales bacterium]
MLTKNKVFVVIVLLVSLMLPFTALAKEFQDVPVGYWAKSEIEELAGLGFLAGTPDGNFNPDNPVTRAEFAAMIVKSLKMTVTGGSTGTFKDVPKKHWAIKAVETVSKAGFVVGDKGKFRPDDKISRQEMAVIIMRISEKNGYPGEGSTSSLGRFKDSDQISGWAAPSVGDATNFGYIREVSYSVYESTYSSSRYNRVLAPLDNATRAQAAVSLHNLLVKTGLI